ncbi:hypothetical protein BY996DRAFT_2647757 [Phakopsora pachyrhizi]|uniref:COX assembly mitochondrial protein n=1 Tax=Phakopsora pachyrhizi TaxID=170000 RepID=A0AAV0BKZ4_PHAPC|nr:hypothetical protein BY996DRAFT_2647757 [Phakopsora pachyrhizi]CAH7687018.1 hypothetical protein PPACK8108_LOCUS21739 [Phakopsora pachyrhizi]
MASNLTEAESSLRPKEASTLKFKTLSRREEDELQRRVKLASLKRCDPIVREFANCSSDKTFSVIWSCREQWKSLKSCMRSEMTEEKVDEERLKFISDLISRDQLKVPYKKL